MARQEDDIDVLRASWGLTHINWREHGPHDDPIPVDPTDWTQHNIHHAIAGPRSVFATDVDHYGDTDIIAAVRTHDDIIWWKNHRSQSFAKHITQKDLLGAESTHSAELDGDGDAAVLAAMWWDRAVGWRENDGDEKFTKHVIRSGFLHTRSVSAADVNGGGRPGVLAASARAQVVTWGMTPENRPTCPLHEGESEGKVYDPAIQARYG